jgi:hypothetical protein
MRFNDCVRVVKGVLLAAALLAAVGVGNVTARHSTPTAVWVGPVCRAVTEDSALTDCDYVGGAWYQKK